MKDIPPPSTIKRGKEKELVSLIAFLLRIKYDGHLMTRESSSKVS